MSIRYKVLDLLKSTRSNGYHGKFVGYSSFWVQGYPELTYIEGQWTEAKKELVDLGYGITVFDTLDNANLFCWKNTTSIIYEVEAKGEIKRKGGRKMILSVYDLEDFKHFDVGYGRAYTWPTGTEMYKKIKLLRKVV